MFIKIYFNDKTLFLCNDIDATIQPIIHHDDSIFIDELNSHTVKAMIHEMQQPEVHAGVFFHKDLEELKKAFWKKFSIIKAAGGVVFNENKELLLIFRKGKWDLPKGKLDKGEKIETCSVRETEEETGLKNVKAGKMITITYHTYHEGARFRLKETYWFNLSVRGKQELSPQIEEDIKEAKWINPADLGKYMNNSYESVRDVLQIALN
jgi:ADP-ribose pyrophosphatase YjhB (NUDIX family)